MSKRIICLIDSLGPGGAQRQLIGLASSLKDHNYDVAVVCYHDNRFYVDQLLSKGVPYVFLKKAQKTTFRMWHVARYLRKVNPDVVISYLETPSICACVAKIFNHKFKLIVSERNTTQHTGWQEVIRFNLFRIADFVVPNSFAQEDYLRTSFPHLTDKIVTIPNFVDLNYFVPPKTRSRRSVPEILIVASIWAPKNTLGLIESVPFLKDKVKFHINWYGLTAANKDYSEKCFEKIDELRVGDYLELKEKTQKIRECYQDADFFCLPSFYEGTPNVICEAMASGLPIACSDVCDNSRYVKEGENGFLFNPNEAESIAEALERMLSLDEYDYLAYCYNSRKRAEEMLTEDKFVQSYLKLIEQ